MPVQAEQQTRRREAIARILAKHAITRQSELLKLLRAEGVSVTQSSISRDLQDMGVMKLHTGYALPESTQEESEQADFEPIAGFVHSIRTAGPNLTIILTAAGTAQRLALSLDRAGWPEVVGTISGDDTIFVATMDRPRQKSLLARLAQTIGVRETKT